MFSYMVPWVFYISLKDAELFKNTSILISMYCAKNGFNQKYVLKLYLCGVKKYIMSSAASKDIENLMRTSFST